MTTYYKIIFLTGGTLCANFRTLEDAKKFWDEEKLWESNEYQIIKVSEELIK